LSAESPRTATLQRRLVVPLLALLITAVLGTLGYHWVWREYDGTWMDSLFMTMNILTTIGLGEIHPLSDLGRVLTMVVAVTGIGSLFYLFGVVMDFLVAAQVGNRSGERQMMQKIESLEHHVVVAGLGRVGRETAKALHESRTPFVAVDPLPEAIQFAKDHGYLFLQGDCSADAVLEGAGIGRARALIATTNSDATNLYVVLSARLLNPKLHIVSRVVEEASAGKLIRAGANRAVSPHTVGGRRLAHLIMNPGVVDLFETALRKEDQALDIEDLAIEAGNPLVGQTLGALEAQHALKATILCILRAGTSPVRPRNDLVLQAGDRMIALGTESELEGLARAVAPNASAPPSP
jgi:voltage-gated potassium channel